MKRLERGWPAHYCCANRCLFRRNTLLDDRIIVSTVGLCVGTDGYREIGDERYYETMAFYADASEYHNVVDFKGIAMLKTLNVLDDMKANTMHEDAVNEIIARMESGDL